MRSLLFCKNFPGVHVSIHEVHKHPCPHSQLACHIDVGYRLVQFHITDENPFVPSGYQALKLISVKQTWNIKLREQTENVLRVERDDIILDLDYSPGEYNGAPVDFIIFTLKNLRDGFITYYKAFLRHSVNS